MRLIHITGLLIVAPLLSMAAIINVGSLTVPAINPNGVALSGAATVFGADTLASFTASDLPCLQTGPQYCTNAAGVVVTAGTTGVGGTSTFSGPPTFNFGSLLFGNSTLGFVQLFPANAANGLGSANPPTILTFNGASLASLFPAFPVAGIAANQLSFRVADTLYTDNTGNFVIHELVPEPATFGFLGLGLAALGLWHKRRFSSK
jgi:hypothetical protein